MLEELKVLEVGKGRGILSNEGWIIEEVLVSEIERILV
jgi:hypothetical protein